MKGREAMDGISKPADEAGAQPAKKRKRTNANRRGEAKYKKEKQKRFSVNFFPTDYKLYEHAILKSEESSISAYIKSLIREDMERSSR